jgi:heat shock protein HslJ
MQVQLNRSMIRRSNPMNKIWLNISLCAGMMVLAACTSQGSQQGGDLTGTVWALTELMGKPPVAGTGISAEFTADGKVSGSAGCNRYSGSYTVSGNNITFSSPMASTMMMCEQAVMDQESAYLNALGEVTAFAINGDQLTLSAGDGTQLAVYTAQSQDLAGTNWEATAYNNGKQAVVGVEEGTTLTASFGKDGNLSGNAGCNQYNGSYTVNDDQITIGPLASTMMMCSDPAGVMDQEAQYLAALQSAANYQIEGNVLQLRTADDAIAVFFNKK